ncbi:MAG: zinc metallopeptidase [Clostridia bacterium]|nr:zinc metallopeptidase [Clostridia bacterium]
MGFFYGFDSTYFYFVIPALIISLLAQVRVKSAFSKFSQIPSSRNISGADAARQVLSSHGVANVRIERVAGSLTDHYDPKANVIRLSESVFDSTSIAAIGVAAHEAGHAVQYAKGYAPIKFRAGIINISRIGSMLSWPIFLMGLVFNFTPLMDIGILLFCALLLFQLITLPVEFNASRRAIQTLGENNILYMEELTGAKKVLSAAAMTYVAAMISSLAHLLRLLVLSNRRR